jgi:cytochrome b involved in lipid metabolism
MIDDKWYDVKPFFKIHPGGEKILKKYQNKDATIAFHSIKAHNNYYRALNNFLINDEKIINKLNDKIKTK